MERHKPWSVKVAVCVSLILTRILSTTCETDTQDVTALNSLKALWQNVPPTWNDFADPCGNLWEGISCQDSRVISITLSSLGLKGSLSGDIQGLTALKTLDLSYNTGLSGPLPQEIGKLSKLTNLILIGCNFNGEIPQVIGSLSQLRFLSLNSNGFRGSIPNSLGNLAELHWLDLADNKLTGTIPVSNATAPGLDMLVHTYHFHFGKNQLSGSIPPKLFHQNMTLIHLLLDNNNFTGSVPSTIGLVTSLEVVRLDQNSLTGSVPSNMSNLTNLTDLLISNNGLTGSFPDLTGMNSLNYLDMSNNTFAPSEFPSSLSALLSLTTLIMERTQMEGTIPDAFFSLPQLQTVRLKKNKLSGVLDLGVAQSSQLELVDLQNNYISAYTQRAIKINFQLILYQNPLCADVIGGENYCNPSQPSKVSYATPQNCVPVVCSSNKVCSPNCQCAYPYSGILFFRAVKFSYLQNTTYYSDLQQSLLAKFQSLQIQVDSVSLSNISRDESNYLRMTLEIFPLGKDRFDRETILNIGFTLSNQTFKPPQAYYGPFYFIGHEYTAFADEPAPKKGLSMATIIGIAVGSCAFVVVLLYIGACILCKKRPARMAESVNHSGFGSSTSWMSPGSNLKLTGSRSFSFEEIEKMTNNFSNADEIGSGAYGKVYRATLIDGQLAAVKRAGRGSKQGRPEFSSEIQLLSRVHHKNLVRLLGFCLEKEEFMLVYEYVPNGTLGESLSGKSGITLDWKRRIKVALGTARGLAYLHELANPPIIHRDIKSDNILLDENLDPKVSDFGLSRPLDDHGTGHIVTEVKGTMGYLDPEYYMTQKLNEKSDVYSFGVVMLEVITARPPIDKGKYIVREVRRVINREKELCGLQELLDRSIGTGSNLGGFEKYVNLAARCVQDEGTDRPAMGEVVKQLEDILEMAGPNPYSDSSTSSATFDDGKVQPPYGDSSLYTRAGALPR